MKNIVNYINKYGDKSFKEKGFTNLDFSILSIIPYIDYKESVNYNEPLGTFLSRFLFYTDKKEYIESTVGGKEIYSLIEVMVEKKRYKDILVSDYVYKVNDSEQFAAITYQLDNKNKFIAFEGTNNLLIGWEEDFTYSYLELTPADKDAIKYLNRVISIFDKNIYVGGHSKGGRLALISSMYISRFKQDKIRKIYSFDGPGISLEQLESKEYKLVANKFIHIIPNYSIVGLLLRHDNNYKVVKSSKMDISAHFMFTWYVDDDDFIYTELSNVSKKLDNSIVEWLDEHTVEERKLIVKSIFNIFRDNNITSVNELKNIKNIYNIITSSRSYDNDTLKVIKNFLTFNVSSIIKNK